MSSEATLALTNNQIKDLLDKGQLNSPQLKTSLKQAKVFLLRRSCKYTRNLILRKKPQLSFNRQVFLY